MRRYIFVLLVTNKFSGKSFVFKNHVAKVGLPRDSPSGLGVALLIKTMIYLSREVSFGPESGALPAKQAFWLTWLSILGDLSLEGLPFFVAHRSGA